MRFELETQSILASIGGVLIRALAGPAILMRNAWRCLAIQTRPRAWFGISAAIAAVWSSWFGTLLVALMLTSAS